MTALCGGGPSAAKAGVVENNIISAALIDGGLAAISPWLLIFAGMIDAFIFDTTAQCTTDPPAIPSSADLDPINIVGGVLNPNHQIWLDAVGNLLMRYFWFQFCECTSTTTPVFVNPTPPSTSVSPTGSTQSPCSDRTWQGIPIVNPFSTAANPQPVINDQVLPYNTFVTRTVGGLTYKCSVFTTPLPTQIIINQQYVSGGAGGFAANIDWVIFDASGTQIQNSGTNSIIQGSVTSNRTIVTIPSTAHDIYFEPVSVNQSTPDLQFSAEFQVICAGGTAGAPSAPCEADPMLLALLQQILTMVNAIYSGLPTPLNSYADATSHSGLTGSGTVTLVDNPIAIRVDITTDNAHLSQEAGNPTFLFDRGFIVPIVNSAPVRGDTRLVYDPQMYVLPALTEQIGYTLAPGITATIVELTAGP